MSADAQSYRAWSGLKCDSQAPAVREAGRARCYRQLARRTRGCSDRTLPRENGLTRTFRQLLREGTQELDDTEYLNRGRLDFILRKWTF